MAEKRTSSRGRGGARAREKQGEQLEGSGWKTALIQGSTFNLKAVQYTEVDGLAIFEGDIVLGTAEEVASQTEMRRQAAAGQIESAVLITGADKRWPNCRVPYDIDSAMPDQARVTDAIAHWEANTRFRFTLRTAQNAAQFPDWVTFRAGSGCSSTVGRAGGQQFVNLGSSCTKGNAIHEIGHTIGLWHEQSREDRDSFVTIHWDKIQAGLEHNFDQHISDGDDVGAYDYGSIMHYPRDAFSVDGSDTITPVDATASIGQRVALSAGDIAAANSICPQATIKEVPKDPLFDTHKEFKEPVADPTQKEVVADTIKEATADPTHKEVVADTIKEATADPTQKEVVADTIKEATADPTQKEVVADTIKEATADPTIKEVAADPTLAEHGGTLAEHPGFPGGPQGPVLGPGMAPGGAVPFAAATGHQAPALTGGAVPGAAPAAPSAALEAELGQLVEAAQRADADRAALGQRLEQLAAQLAAARAAEGGGGA